MTPDLRDNLTQESGTASQRDPSKLDEWATKTKTHDIQEKEV